MAQKKGQTGNPYGRPKGKPNKITSQFRDILGEVLSKEITPGKISSLLKDLEPNQRINALTKLLEFVSPKLQAVDIRAQIEAEYRELEKLLEKCPDEVIDQLEKRIVELKNNEQHLPS